MIYLNAKEAAKKWELSVQTVLKYCHCGTIAGAYKQGKTWMIPDDSVFPVRRTKKLESPFTFIDLFCGIGGFHQAMRSLGGKCVFACDINTQCRDVYTKNFCPNGEFPVMGDIIDAISQKAIPQFDVLCGGFPCQTFSKAGLQNGFKVVENERGEKDERGQLFYRIIDILKEHPECKYIVLENVRNLADKKDNWDIICDELKGQGFIITEEPLIASPHTYGVPQIRERVFILGIRSSAFDWRKKLPKGYLTSDILHIENYKKPISDKDNNLKTILDDDVDDKYCVSPEIEEILNIWDEFRENVKGLMSPFWIHKAGIGIYDREAYLFDPDIGFQDMPKWKQTLVMKSRVMYENNFEFIDNWIAIHNMRSRNMLHQKFEWNVGSDCETMRDGIIQIRQSGIRVKRPNYFPSLVVMRNTPIVWDKNKCHYRFITPREASKLQSFDDGFIFAESDAISYEQLGNSVNVELVKIFARELFQLGKGSSVTMIGGKSNG